MKPPQDWIDAVNRPIPMFRRHNNKLGWTFCLWRLRVIWMRDWGHKILFIYVMFRPKPFGWRIQFKVNKS